MKPTKPNSNQTQTQTRLKLKPDSNQNRDRTELRQNRTPCHTNPLLHLPSTPESLPKICNRILSVAVFALIKTEHFPKNCLQSCPAVKTSLRISSSRGPACHLSGLDKSARIGCFPAGVADFTLPCTHCELFFRIDPREPSQRFRYPVIARCMPSWAPSVAGRRSLHEFSPEIWLKRPLRRPTGGHKACRPAFHRFPWPAKNPLPPASDRYFFPGRSDSLVDTIRVHLGSSGIFGRFRGFLSTGFPPRPNRSPPAFPDALPESVGRSGNRTGRGGFWPVCCRGRPECRRHLPGGRAVARSSGVRHNAVS